MRRSIPRFVIMLSAFLRALSAPLDAAAQEAPAAPIWQEALSRIELYDHQAAIPLLDDLRRRENFSRAREAQFLLGMALFRQKQWQEAADVLEAAAAQVPSLGDYALYYAASAYQTLNLNAPALTILSRLLHEYPDSLLAERARQERARLYLSANQLAPAEEAYRDYLAHASSDARRREAFLALAEIALKLVPDPDRGADKQQEAEGWLHELWLKWPGTREAARADELLASMPQAPPFTADEQFERALSLHRSGQYTLAITAFAPFLSGDPRFASRARLWSGISHFQRRDYSLAISLLSPLGQDNSLHAAEALYWIGRSYVRSNEREKAIATWTRLTDAFPSSSFAAESLYLMALQESDNREPKRAVRALNRLIKEYSSSRFINAALWTRAWIRYRQSAFRQALDDLQHLYTRDRSDPRFRVQALYWQGRVLEDLKKRGKAAEVYRRLLSLYGEDDYYAEQTRRRLKLLKLTVDGRRSAATPYTLHPTPCSSNPAPCAADTEKARLLKELKLRDEASEEFKALAGRYADDRGVLYEACGALHDLGYLDKSVWIAKRLLRPMYMQTRPAEPVPRYWEFLYPLGYWELVQEQSARHAIDPYLVVALIREESAFGERVVSSSGAVGLMQLLPTTATGMVNNGGKSAEPIKLHAPPTNIALGTRYLAMMIGEFKGNWARALAAYNAGPNQVRRWLERLGDRGDDEFIEEIPFSETNAYVKRVLGSYYRYRAQYDKESGS